LLGDFAFAIWDERQRQLFCARDHMGMRQLIYHHDPGRLFAFATEAEAVLAHRGVPRQINEARVADFLDVMEGIDFTTSFYDSIFRLPPAHHMTVDTNGLSLRRYWRLELPPELKLSSDKDYERAFLEVFTEAVRCRLRSPGPIGATLSGGIDSGSVAAVAAQLLAEDGREPLLTFSALGPDPLTCVETRHVLAAMANPAFRAASIDHNALDPQRDELMHHFITIADPFDCHMTMVRAVYLLARRQGVKVVLDGAWADIVLVGDNRVAQCLLKGRLLQAVREARIQAKHSPLHGSLRILLAAAWAQFAPQPIRRLKRRVTRLLQDRRVLSGKARLSSSLAHKVDILTRRSVFRGLAPVSRPSSLEYRLESISHPHNVAGRERYDRVASALAIEPRDPFFDRRVIEFCLSLPAAQLHSGDWPKLILRRASAGLVPDTIRWRRSKEHVGFKFTRSLLASASDQMPHFTRMLPILAGYVSPAKFSEIGPSTAMDTDANVELFGLACWLERNLVQRVKGSEGEA
jgi:asparagine synthase (glutamine-hydrolysing)